MKALPSIAFSQFKGSAGNVTARVSKGRQILSAKALHNNITTVAQAARRCSFASISRSYRNLTQSQMAGWALLAEKLKGTSAFGQSAELTPHNAFVRLNTSRTMAGMPLLLDAPAYASDIPAVQYDDLWISPQTICFIGLQQPTPNHLLVFKMSPSLSPGTSSGWGKAVIITPGYTPEWGDAELTSFYTSVIGYAPEVGKKYYCSFYWMDKSTGFTGEEIQICAICREESLMHNAIYAPRVRVTMDTVTTDSVENLDMELAPGIPIANVNVSMLGDNIAASSRFELKDISSLPKFSSMWLIGRASLTKKYTPILYQSWIETRNSVSTCIIAHRAGMQSDEATINCTGFYK
ncbi:MAG: hypothetical protein IJ476_04130 [Bacteroidales bacterium]|nr:hypothetical protein [Bacteroidales bacterium]